jgi:serine protease
MESQGTILVRSLSTQLAVIGLALASSSWAAVDAPARVAGLPSAPPEASRASSLVNGQVVVRFRADCPAQRRGEVVRSLGCQMVGMDSGSGFALVRPRGGRTADFLAVLARRPEVIGAEPSYQLHTCANPQLYDPYEWNLFPRGVLSARAPSLFGIQAPDAWTTTRGAGVTVAMVDTGVAYENNHPYLQAPALAGTHFVPGYDFVNGDDHPNDDAGHGTHVTGILADTPVSGGGTVGVATDATVMPLKAMGADGSGSDFAIAEAIRWAADNGASVINLSLGGQGAGSVLADACRYAAQKDCVLVAAAGNQGLAEVGYPAFYSYCIAVGATGFDGTRAPYSNYGSRLLVMAPGGNLNQDLNGDGRPDGILAQTFDPQQGYDSFDYIFEAGTSMATAEVSGVVALMRSANPALSALAVRSILKSTAFPLGGTGARNDNYGYGLVDARGAVQAALAKK